MNASLSLPVLNHRFQGVDAYRASRPYEILPLRFVALDAARVVVTNLVGEHLVLSRPEFELLVNGRLSPQSALYAELVARHIVLDDRGQSALDLLAVKYRTRQSALADFTGLHMFVVTLRCDHSCPYCQVSRVSSDRAAFDMTPATAERALDLVFASPNPRLKIEFQGGEPLLNFPLIEHIVLQAKARNTIESRDLQFVIATNLALITDDILAFCKTHNIFISTSLDGPAVLHNANRPRPGRDAYERTVDGIRRCREMLGHDAVSALMTTTAGSLEQPEAIIDEYVSLGFDSLFLRWLSPYGFAKKTGSAIGYGVAEWTRFYERGLRHILALNQGGVVIREELASIVLRKMTTPYPTSYVDLQSPAGIGIAAAVYNYDGDVYASDEGRMLAEMGNRELCLGNVHRHDYRDIFLSDRLINLLASTMTDTVPMCHDCGFEPWCGSDPSFHIATQGDPIGHRPTSAFCARNMHVFRLLVQLLEDDPAAAAILRQWA